MPGRVIVITGASDGIGREIALRYANRKHKYNIYFSVWVIIY